MTHAHATPQAPKQHLPPPAPEPELRSPIRTVCFTGAPTSGTALLAEPADLGEHAGQVAGDPGWVLRGNTHEGLNRAETPERLDPQARGLLLPGTALHAAWTLAGRGEEVRLDGLGARRGPRGLELRVGPTVHLGREQLPYGAGPEMPGRRGQPSVCWSAPPFMNGMEALLGALGELRGQGQEHELRLGLGVALRLVAALSLYADDPSPAASELARAEVCGGPEEIQQAWAAWGLIAEEVAQALCRRAPEARRPHVPLDALADDAGGPWLQLGMQAGQGNLIAVAITAAAAWAPEGEAWKAVDDDRLAELRTVRHGNLVAVHARMHGGRRGTHLLWRSQAITECEQRGMDLPRLRPAEDRSLRAWLAHGHIERQGLLLGALQGRLAQGRA